MILGIGIDVVDIDRMRESLARRGRRLHERLFTAAEQAYCDQNVNAEVNYAARFAAKEAFAKALGSGIAEGICWVDVEVAKGPRSEPVLVLHRRAAEALAAKGGRRVWLSLTHSARTAAAVVIIEGDGA